MKSSVFAWLLLAATGGLVLTGCQRDPVADLSAEDSQVFLTNHTNTAFTQYKTFSIPDSLLLVENGKTTPTVETVALMFLDQVAQNLTSRGFKRVAASQNPDLIVTPAYVINSQTGITPVYNPWFDPYWGMGWGGGWGGYGWNMPPYQYQYYTTTESYWYVRLGDLKNAAANGNKINVVWDSQIRGNGLTEASQIANLVNAVFAQSPYLKTN